MSDPFTDVVASVAHDLRGALGSVRLALAAAADEPDVDVRIRLTDLADGELKRFASAIDGLEAAARMTSPTGNVEAMLPDALDRARAAGVSVTGVSPNTAPNTDRPGAAGLGAIIALAAGSKDELAATLSSDTPITLTLAGGEHSAVATCLIEHLAGRIGAIVRWDGRDSLELRWE